MRASLMLGNWVGCASTGSVTRSQRQLSCRRRQECLQSSEPTAERSIRAYTDLYVTLWMNIFTHETIRCVRGLRCFAAALVPLSHAVGATVLRFRSRA
jgi:hypothetical protein